MGLVAMTDVRVLAAIPLVLLIGCGGESVKALDLGQEAVVEHAPFTDPPSSPTDLGITVLGVRPGTIEELETIFELDLEERTKAPYYVDVRFENDGEETIERELSVSMEDQDGNLISPVVIFDFGGPPYESCTDNTEGQLAPGESFETCTLFLVPEGRRAARVSFLPNVPGEETDWVYWAIP